ncbi:MAG: oligosaccharide flippase family protein [Lachnospiraceae bacterium]|nr:oligosaccharide flippase family protein [Lachnospiraceae bacterium]
MRSLQKHPLIFGTLLLTGAGLICRFMGFFYRIYISRIFDAEGMGIHSLIMPVVGLTFSLTGACFQTCISKFVAEQKENEKQPFTLALTLCVPLALLISLLLHRLAEPISRLWLAEPRCQPLLEVFSLAILPSAINSCIKGYCYGRKKTLPPCICQIIEQIIRIGSVFLLVDTLQKQGTTPPLVIMVLGMVFGELASLLCALLFHFIDSARRKRKGTIATTQITYATFFSMLLPLISNRIFLNVLQSMETVAIPVTLERYGLTRSEALSIYGVFTGMVMPLLFFPTTLTGSISVLLLPSVSEYQARGEYGKIKSAIRKNITFCLTLGILSILFFFTCGPYLGKTIYDNELAGSYIRIASFISPFLYLNSTLSGILQGLGKTTLLFGINVSLLIIRLFFIHLTIPVFGIPAYLYLLLFTQLVQFLLYYRSLRSYV